jgi:hypothetical protein
MPELNFNLRNIAPNVMVLLKKEAVKQKTSVNSVILQMIEQGVGVTHKRKKTVYHDLDHLIGTWTDEDKKEFDEYTKCFEKIDPELWL